jgi:DNA-binding NarL/FixJ family response regulator
MSLQEILPETTEHKIEIPKLVNILIVDDRRLDRACLRRICSALDFEVNITEAGSLIDMSAALRHSTFDLVFLDFHMPDGNGLLAMKIIQFDLRNKHAAIVMVTGDSDADIVIGAMQNGCHDFINKDAVSRESVRRATLNALQKVSLNNGLKTQTAMRTDVESVLDHFTQQCIEEFHPMLFNMLRHVRSLQAVKQDEDKFKAAMQQIENICARLFDFMDDIEHQDRKAHAFKNAKVAPSSPSNQKKSAEPIPIRPKLFGHHPSQAAD